MRSPEVPWPAIVALRNRIAHGYETVDHLLVWQIITLDAPQLASAMDRLLAADSDLPYDEGSST
ncbi:MAG TPA: HepT-like ribonuclease domain-containing protein [Caulobacteraceae bacterium]